MTDLSQHFTTAKLLKYTAPSMAMMALMSVYGIVDGLFVSNFVGKEAFASVTIAMPFVMILGTFGMMMGAGGSALVGHLLGAGKDAEANGAFSLIAYTTLALGAVAAVAGIALMEPVVRLMGAPESVVSLATTYGRIAIAPMPLFMTQYAFESFSATAGKPQLGLYATIVAGATNIALDALFIVVFHWGITGAALATGIAESASGLFMLAMFARGRGGMLKLGKPSGGVGVLTRAAGNGVSEMVASVAMSVVAVAYNFQLMRYFGEDGVAAYGAIEFAAMIFAAMLEGYCSGSAPLLSYQHGAGNAVEIRSLIRHGFIIMSLGGLAALALSQAFAPLLAQAFTGYDQGLSSLTERAFRIYSISFLFVGFTMFGSATFTALGNGAVSAAISFVHTLVFEVGSVMLLPGIFGPESIWWSIVVAETAASIVVLALVATRTFRTDNAD